MRANSCHVNISPKVEGVRGGVGVGGVNESYICDVHLPWQYGSSPDQVPFA